MTGSGMGIGRQKRIGRWGTEKRGWGFALLWKIQRVSRDEHEGCVDERGQISVCCDVEAKLVRSSLEGMALIETMVVGRQGWRFLRAS